MRLRCHFISPFENDKLVCSHPLLYHDGIIGQQSHKNRILKCNDGALPQNSNNFVSTLTLSIVTELAVTELYKCFKIDKVREFLIVTMVVCLSTVIILYPL